MTNAQMQAKPNTFHIQASDIDITEILQDALDTAGPSGLKVTFGAGKHICRGIKLPSHTELHLDAGAEVQFVPTYDAYAHTSVTVEAEQSNRAMIVATGAKDIALTGTGKITCQGSTAFSRGDDNVMGTIIPFELRPRVMVLDCCEDVRLNGITVQDSPMWTLHFVGCKNVNIRDVRIDNNRRMPNTDGIVIDGCQNVTITDTEIRTADDGVVLKTSARLGGGVVGVCENIQVSRCTIESRSCALKLGTESFSLFKDITFEDCKIEKSNRGLGIFSRDGGAVENVRFSRIDLECIEAPAGFWGSGEAITITVLDRRPDTTKAGNVSGVVIEDITGTMEGTINMWAERSGGITDVSLKSINLTQKQGALGTALTYDLRPTPADLEPSPDAAGRVNAWRLGPDGRVIGLTDYPGGMPSVFAHNVTDMKIQHLDVTRPTPLPKAWNPALTVEETA